MTARNDPRLGYEHPPYSPSLPLPPPPPPSLLPACLPACLPARPPSRPASIPPSLPPSLPLSRHPSFFLSVPSLVLKRLSDPAGSWLELPYTAANQVLDHCSRRVT